MTKEEAIEVIEQDIPCEHDTDLIEALEMAIKALEQENILEKIRSEIEALIDWHDCPIEYDNGNDAWYCEACNQAIKIVDKYKARREETE